MAESFLNPKEILKAGETLGLQNQAEAVDAPVDSHIWDWKKSQTKLQTLHSSWEPVLEQIKKNRKNRKLEFDKTRSDADGTTQKDEIILPRRVINNNISRGRAPFMAFVKDPERTIVANCITDPSVKTLRLEKEFTNVCRYEGWELAHYICLDSAMLNGWASMQTVFDPNAPGGFIYKPLTTDKLLFPKDISDIQKSAYISITVDVTKSQLKSWVTKFGFNKEVVEEMFRNDDTEENETDKSLKINNLMYKAPDGIVRQAWYKTDAKDWLLPPKKLYIGKQAKVEEPVPTAFGPMHGTPELENSTPTPATFTEMFEREYPVDIYVGDFNEDEKITEHFGHGEKDVHMQAAQTAMVSAFVNQTNRSQYVYASPKADSGTGGAPKIDASVELKPNSVYTHPMEFWSQPPPSSQVLAAINALDMGNSQEQNQLSHTVVNRDDARKTKKEFEVAEDLQSNVSSVAIVQWSIFQRRISNRAFGITMSRARQGKLEAFMQQMTEPKDEQGQPIIRETREYIIAQKYNLKAAGDVEIVERKKILGAMKEAWPLIQNTAAGPEFLIDMLEMSMPASAGKYTDILRQGKPAANAVAALIEVVNKLAQQAGVEDDQLGQIQALVEKAQQMTQPIKPQQPNA